MTQFQKELWPRFTSPLVRLDRAGIEQPPAGVARSGRRRRSKRLCLDVSSRRPERKHFDALAIPLQNHQVLEGSHVALRPLQSAPIREGRPDVRNAAPGVAIDLRTQETQHLPALCLKLVGLPCVVDALADGRMKFQAVSVYEDALRRNVGEIGARQQAAARIVHLVLLHRFRQPSGSYRSEKSKLQRRFAAFLASLIPLWSLPPRWRRRGDQQHAVADDGGGEGQGQDRIGCR